MEMRNDKLLKQIALSIAIVVRHTLVKQASSWLSAIPLSQ